jgi:hypothetical protein
MVGKYMIEICDDVDMKLDTLPFLWPYRRSMQIVVVEVA